VTRDALDDHLHTFRVQGRFAAHTLRTTADLLERELAGDLDVAAADRLRSQLGAALRAARTSKQLAAQAAALIQAHTARGGTTNGRSSNRERSARVG
jgi:hypothetical protein